MIHAIGDHIISPLGVGTEANLQAILNGQTLLRTRESVHGQVLKEPFVGSVFDTIPQVAGLSDFEGLCMLAAEKAIEQAGIDASASNCVFVLSSTKGNIWTSMADSARKVAQRFGNEEAPIVVTTACTSGVSAQLVAYRLLKEGRYTRAIVIGCDVQNEFIVSGFQSFKALSDEPCKPFDAARKGLNAGEAVACLVLENTDAADGWCLIGGSIHNDANHISGPSRTAEGSLRCLDDMLQLVKKDELGCVSVHGTGTNYNDEMESLAIHRADLDDIPVSALKGFYGHTMGAAGLMETILTMKAMDKGLILPSKGFEQQGTTHAVNISSQSRATQKQAFIKLLSGFGGVNASVAWKRVSKNLTACATTDTTFEIAGEVRLTAEDNLVSLYREVTGDYPKFFKMDTLSRLGFVAVEMLKRQIGAACFDEEKTAIILANKSASLQNDTAYQETIQDKANYYPSPALFVYTLPNIVTGELAIRHRLYGETAFYVLPNEDALQPLVELSLKQSTMESAIAGWVECTAKDQYEAHVYFVKKK